MNLSTSQTVTVEAALDELFVLVTKHAPKDTADYRSAVRRYELAAAIVRERPAGQRRQRSDVNWQHRSRKQAGLPV
jgi:hypothetical protein